MSKSARIRKIGDKYYDLQTPNKSFLSVAKDLKNLGVKNWYFLLEIKDPSVAVIDPFKLDKEGNVSLSNDQISRIMLECARNPWYYLREICRIPDQGGTSVRYKANRGNIAQAWCVLHGLDSWLCLPRQQGKTVSALAIEVWGFIFGTTNSTIIQINKDGDNAKANLTRMKDQIDLLPKYMQCKYIYEDDVKVKAKENATTLGNPVTRNSVIIKPKAPSYEKALSIARGLTAPILHFDEPEFTSHIGTIVSNSVSTYDSAAANAKANGAMYARIFTCTPGDLDTAPGIEAQIILDKTAKWTERMYDWSADKIDEYLLSQGSDCNKILYIEYSYLQIGRTYKWLQDISAKIGNKITVRREILLQRLHGSSLSPFPQEDIQYITETVQKPIDELWLLDYYRFDIYKKLQRDIPYIAGIDCSTGTNSDNNAITLINPFTLRPDAEFECNYIGEKKFEELLIELCKVLPRVVLCIERNSVGDSVIDHLLDSEVAGRLYFDRALNLQEAEYNRNASVVSMLKKESAKKTYYGVYTGTKSRQVMMSILADRVNNNKDDFVTNNIIRDLSRLVRTASGKIVAGIGKDEEGEAFHDDSIMSYLIALYVYFHGDNLNTFGIQRGYMGKLEENKGLIQRDVTNSQILDSKIIEGYKKTKEKEAKANKELDYESMLKSAIIEAQNSEYNLYKHNMISGTVYSNTPDSEMENFMYDTDIPLDFFTEINGGNVKQ